LIPAAIRATGASGASLRALRPRLVAALDQAVEHAARVQRDKELGQADLFHAGPDVAGAPVPIVVLPDATPWSDMELLAAEKEALGLFWTGHPMDAHTTDLAEIGARTIAELQGVDDGLETAVEPLEGGRAAARPGEDVSVGGIISAIRPLKTRKGDPMAVMTLEDHAGTLEVVVFPETFKLSRAHIETGALVIVRGKLERDDEASRILASDVQPIGTVRERLAREMAITVSVPPHGRETFEALADLFARHRGDKPVTFQLVLRGAQTSPLRVRAQVSAVIRVKPSSVLVDEVEKICGPGAVLLR
jgi:DNA polymerase-3 subunit alpha